MTFVALAGLAVPAAHGDVATWGGEEEGAEVREEFEITQDEYNWAQGVNFTNFNTDSDINGWYIIISVFEQADSAADGLRDVDVEAYGESIAQGTTIDVDATQWVEQYNEMGLKDVVWTEEAARAQQKVMPDHHWSVGFPTPVPGQPGFYSHTFTMDNADPLYPLTVSGLTFLPSMTYEDPLRGILFIDPPHESYTLAVGESWTFDVVTDGTMMGGYVYFTYHLYSVDGLRDVCKAWAAHPIISPCSADITGGTGVPDLNVDALDFLLLISQWGSPCFGPCEADITGPTGLPDGNVDALDFLELIGQWGSPGACPTP